MRNETIANLLKIRETAANDLRGDNAKKDRQWVADRIHDIQWANEQLIRLGAIG